MVSSLDGFIAKKDNSVSWFVTASAHTLRKGDMARAKKLPLQSFDCVGCLKH